MSHVRFSRGVLYTYDIRYRLSHDDVIKWKHFPRYWSFVRGIHRSSVNSPHKGQWGGALMFSFICAWIKRAHYDIMSLWHYVIVMKEKYRYISFRCSINICRSLYIEAHITTVPKIVMLECDTNIYLSPLPGILSEINLSMPVPTNKLAFDAFVSVYVLNRYKLVHGGSYIEVQWITTLLLQTLYSGPMKSKQCFTYQTSYEL